MYELPNKEYWNQWALLALRVVIGFGFMFHGWAKVSSGVGNFAAVVEWIGIPFPLFMAWVVTLVELFGGLAMLLGVLVTLVSVPLVMIHLVAMFGIHLRYGFSAVQTVGFSQATGPQFAPPGFEISLFYIGGLLVLAVAGAGALSVDRMLARRNGNDAG